MEKIWMIELNDGSRTAGEGCTDSLQVDLLTEWIHRVCSPNEAVLYREIAKLITGSLQ